MEATTTARTWHPWTIWLPCVLAFLWSGFLIFGEIVVSLLSNMTDSGPSQIVGIQLRHLADRAADIGITLEVDQAAEAWLATRGYDPEYGARPLRRVIQQN